MIDKPSNHKNQSYNFNTIPPWGLRELLAAFFLGFVAVPLGFSFLISLFADSISPLARLLTLQIAFYVVWVLILALLAKQFGRDVIRYLGLRREKKAFSYIVDGFFCGGSILMVGWLIGFLASYFKWSYEEPYSIFEPEQLRAISILAVMIAPFMEEVIFRGFLQTTLYRYLTVGQSILLTSLLFTLFHSLYYENWIALAYVGMMALILSAFRYSTGSTIPGIIGHFINNALAALLLLKTGQM